MRTALGGYYISLDPMQQVESTTCNIHSLSTCQNDKPSWLPRAIRIFEQCDMQVITRLAFTSGCEAIDDENPHHICKLKVSPWSVTIPLHWMSMWYVCHCQQRRKSPLFWTYRNAVTGLFLGQGGIQPVEITDPTYQGHIHVQVPPIKQ